MAAKAETKQLALRGADYCTTECACFQEQEIIKHVFSGITTDLYEVNQLFQENHILKQNTERLAYILMELIGKVDHYYSHTSHAQPSYTLADMIDHNAATAFTQALPEHQTVMNLVYKICEIFIMNISVRDQQHSTSLLQHQSFLYSTAVNNFADYVTDAMVSLNNITNSILERDKSLFYSNTCKLQMQTLQINTILRQTVPSHWPHKKAMTLHTLTAKLSDNVKRIYGAEIRNVYQKRESEITKQPLMINEDGKCSKDMSASLPRHQQMPNQEQSISEITKQKKQIEALKSATRQQKRSIAQLREENKALQSTLGKHEKTIKHLRESYIT